MENQIRAQYNDEYVRLAASSASLVKGLRLSSASAFLAVFGGACWDDMFAAPPSAAAAGLACMDSPVTYTTPSKPELEEILSQVLGFD